MAMLEINDLHVNYGMIAALKGISFEVNEGEVISLIGANGAGKTTTLHTLTGLISAKSGSIKFNGVELTKTPAHKIVEMGIAHVPEGRRIFQNLTVLDNLKLGAFTRKDKENIPKDIQDIYERFPRLAERKNQIAGTLSGGEQQRVALARALVNDPQLIIADEPISALDMSIRAQVLNLLRHLQKERGITYLFIAHDLSVMRYISDRIAVIHKGDIVELADAEELVTHAIHPYTRSLLSAIPMPNPRLERKKKLLVYDPAMHDYTQEAPQWRELRPSHWVLCSEQEAKDWLAEM